MRTIALIVLLAVAPCAVAAQGPPRGRMPAAGVDSQRARLMDEVYRRFMDRAAERLKLDAGTRTRLDQVLRQSEARRREFARDAMGVHQQLRGALQSSSTTDADFERLLERLGQLRAREVELLRQEQAELAHVLTPRQRAEFIALRIDFTDRVRRMRAQGGRRQ